MGNSWYNKKNTLAFAIHVSYDGSSRSRIDPHVGCSHRKNTGSYYEPLPGQREGDFPVSIRSGRI